MKWIIGILVSILTVGCCAQKLLNTSTSDSTRIEIRERLVKQIDTVTIEVPIEIERIVTRDTISHLETSFALSDALIDRYGYLHHSIANKPQNRSVEVKTEVLVRDSIVFRDRQIEKVVKVERQLTKWQMFQKNGFWVLLSILIVILGLKLMPIIKKFI